MVRMQCPLIVCLRTGVVQGVVGGLAGCWIADAAADWQRRAGRLRRSSVARALASGRAGGPVCSAGEGAASGSRARRGRGAERSPRPVLMDGVGRSRPALMEGAEGLVL